MRWQKGMSGAACVLMLCAGMVVSGATMSPGRATDTRKLTIVREYDIPVTKGKQCSAAIPAMMSFWGATNQQVITKSDFTYGLNPDKVEVTADNLGMLRRNYELTWDKPEVESIKVTQTLNVELSYKAVLQTAAKLPYSKEVLETYASSLGKSEKINPANPKVDEIAKQISGKSPWAEETVELVCDWVNDNIVFKSKQPAESDVVLRNKFGNCEGMANLACAVLRKMNIPAETVDATFISGNGHAFIEVYFPDAGWVFYDLSNCNRGYKSLDCLLTTGFAFRVSNGRKWTWHEGVFMTAKDAGPYKEDETLKGKLRVGPKENVAGVTVQHVATPVSVQVRQLPISRLIMDLSVPPGKRDYVKESMPVADATTTPKSGE